jgi:RHS repeat-associated protein
MGSTTSTSMRISWAHRKNMTDDGTVALKTISLPFGEEYSLIGSAANDNRFLGQRYEAETGLHYNHWRDYDPTTGSYLQSDCRNKSFKR